MSRLIINPGSPTAWEVQLRPGINLLGRGFANDFKIEDPSVSSSHCQIVVDQGHVLIRDLGSTNGTYVNRAPVREAILQPGQTIHLGAVEMIFQSGPPANSYVSKTEFIPTPAPARPVAGIPAAPPMAKPIVATPIAPGVPQPVVAKPVFPTPALPAGGPATAATPIVIPARPAVAVPVAAAPPAPIVAAPLAPVATAPAPGVVVPRPSGLSLATSIAPRASSSPAITPAVSEAPPPAHEPSFAPPAPIAAAPGSGNCKHHHKTPGRYFCNHCRHFFCELCVVSRATGGVQHKTCRACGSECVPVQVQLHRPVQVGFFTRLTGALGYPLRGAGIILMIVGIVIFTGLKFGRWMILAGSLRSLIFGVLLQIVAGGYLFTYLQSIIHSTVAEDREMPDLPSMSNFAEDILQPFFRLLGLVACCFGPAIGLGIYVLASGENSGGVEIAIIATLVLGGIYFPMAFLAVAILDSVGAANPLVILPSIMKVPLEYTVTVILLAAVAGLRPLGDTIVSAAFPRGWTTHSMGELFAMIGAQAFWGFMSFYLLIVAVHILGLLYVSKKDKLGWLDR